MGERRCITRAFHGGFQPREEDPEDEEKEMPGGAVDPGGLDLLAASWGMGAAVWRKLGSGK
jgi:hypothetical protein